jgi:hypothetical protein
LRYCFLASKLILNQYSHEKGNKKADLKELAVYVKPEESAIYYVVNGSETGKVEF